MVIKPAVRNEYRELFREGKTKEIPADLLAILEAEAEALKAQAKQAKKEKTKEE